MPMAQDCFFDAQEAGQQSVACGNNNQTFKLTMQDQIIQQIKNGLRTATAAIGSSPAQDVQYVRDLLNTLGYTVTIDAAGANMTVTW